MAKRTKEDRISVTYPKFNTIEEQIAFQIGLTLAFNSLARVFDSTTHAILEKGENILKDLGMPEQDAEQLRKTRGGKNDIK